MDAFKSLLGPFGGSSMLDGVKLVVLGGAVETARRGASSAWSSFVNSFYLTTHLTEEDYPYDWVLNWLEKQPAWGRSREFETTTRNVTVGSALKARGAEEDEDMDPEDEDEQAAGDENELVPGKQRVKVMFTPTYDTTHTIFYRGHYLRVKRSKKADGSDVEMLSISVIARSNRILKQLVLQAKREYEADAIHRIQIYFADSHGSWRWTDSRHKRPISSIILNPGVVDMLLADTRDFLKSEKWYADRGIPFRRGYLLWGVPGAGKTSLIHAIAGELQLDIYCLSLSSSWISDSTLTTLMGRVPARCILLLEDLDAAFTRSVTREEGSGSGTGAKKDGKDAKESDAMSDTNSLSLSGLLNALDGVAASEGRLLFATTNHLDRLDPALSRPGRMDVWVEFKNASKWQAEGLFRNFFPIAVPETSQPETPMGGATDGEDRDLTPEEEAEIAGFAFPEVPEQEGKMPAGHVRARTTSYAGPAASAALPTPVATPPRTRVASTTGTRTPTTPVAPSPLSKPSTPVPSSTPVPPASYTPPPTAGSSLAHSAPPMDAAKLARLAKQFADGIPEDEFSVAALQGYLLKNKSQPEAAAANVGEWVLQERALREKLKREKEEKEKKEREEREKRRKEREEKEREEKAKEKAKKDEEEAKKKKEAEEQEKAIQAKKAQEAEAAAKAKAEEEKAKSGTATPPVVPESAADEEKKEAWVAVKKEEEEKKTEEVKTATTA